MYFRQNEPSLNPAGETLAGYPDRTAARAGFDETGGMTWNMK
jgi:hypothetical protein